MMGPYPKVAQVKGDSDRLLSPDLCWGRSTLSSTSPLGLETTEELSETPTPKQRQLVRVIHLWAKLVLIKMTGCFPDDAQVQRYRKKSFLKTTNRPIH